MATDRHSSPLDRASGVSETQVFTIASICLALGLLVGYFFVGKHAAPTASRNQAAAATGAPAGYTGGHPKLTLDQMKQMADVQVSALLEKSKADPKNAALLVQIAGIYQATHQFKEGAAYFDKALKINPKNITARTEMASCLYYTGDVDGALDQLDQALKYKPNDANSLFNLGMIKYQGKKDAKGAIAAWQQLLKSNPNLDRKPIVEQMIAEAQASSESKSAAATLKN